MPKVIASRRCWQQVLLADGLGVPAGQQGEEKLTTTAAAIEDESECSRLLRTRNRVGCYYLSHRKKAAQQINSSRTSSPRGPWIGRAGAGVKGSLVVRGSSGCGGCWSAVQPEVLADGQGVSAVQQEVLADSLGVLADRQGALAELPKYPRAGREITRGVRHGSSSKNLTAIGPPH